MSIWQHGVGDMLTPAAVVDSVYDNINDNYTSGILGLGRSSQKEYWEMPIVQVLASQSSLFDEPLFGIFMTRCVQFAVSPMSSHIGAGITASLPGRTPSRATADSLPSDTRTRRCSAEISSFRASPRTFEMTGKSLYEASSENKYLSANVQQ